MATYDRYTPAGTTGDDLFIVRGEGAWKSFRGRSMNGSEGIDTFQVLDADRELRGFAVSVTNGIATISTSSTKVYLTGFEKIIYNGIVKWESTPVVPVAHAPTVNELIATQSVNEGEPFSFTLPATTFNDVDTGDALTLSVNNLPVGFQFDAVTKQISGHSDYAAAGSYQIEVIATDKTGLSASTQFSLTINETPVVNGSNGNDVLTAGVGNDSLIGLSGNDTLNGGSGNDTLNGGSGNDRLNGEAGIDTVNYAGALAGVRVDLSQSIANSIQADVADIGSDILSGIENVIAGAFNDIVVGNIADNNLYAGAGDDSIVGLAGNDTLSGGSGNDTLSGGAGNDRLNGDVGTDTVSYLSALAGVRVDLSRSAANSIQSDAANIGTDLLVSIENVVTSRWDDIVVGNAVNNNIYAGAGNDSIAGLAGNDTLDSGSGNDTLTGGQGADLLTGGTGQDIFKFINSVDSGLTLTTRDTITDFARGSDKIDLSAIDAKTGGTANDVFKLIAASALTAANANGAVWFANGVLNASTDTDLTAEIQIKLTGISAFATTDIIL